jgi:hypothetical protein
LVGGLVGFSLLGACGAPERLEDGQEQGRAHALATVDCCRGTRRGTSVVAATDDHAYGQSAAKNLAISNPTRALDNADNHEYFAENTPSLQ